MEPRTTKASEVVRLPHHRGCRSGNQLHRPIRPLTSARTIKSDLGRIEDYITGSGTDEKPLRSLFSLRPSPQQSLRRSRRRRSTQ